MDQPRTNQDFYKGIDEICLRLTQIGMSAEANRISYRLHNVPWTTTSELFRELYSELKSILTGPAGGKLCQDVKDQLADYVIMLASCDPLNWTPEVGPPQDQLPGRNWRSRRRRAGDSGSGIGKPG